MSTHTDSTAQALARAVYARPTRLVLDDVFSALDANTEHHVFDALFDPRVGLLVGATVILVTNGSEPRPREACAAHTHTL